jgi:cytochrome c oxidase assembly factor CtaG
MSDAVADIVREWELPVWLTASIVLTGAVYVRGWFAIRRTRPRQFKSDQLGFFLSGLAILWVAIASPMDGFADRMLSAHMVEHLLLMSVIPPLVLLGLPTVPLLRGLPRPVLRSVAAPLIRIGALRRLGHWLTSPVVGCAAMSLAFLLWHVPAAYDFALENEFWHDVEHLSFLFTSILFWHSIISPWPTERGRHGWDVVACILAAEGVTSLLCGLLAFSGRPLYRFYFTTVNPLGISPLEDQALGAVVMWVVGSFPFLGAAMGLTVSLLSGGRRRFVHHI